MKHKFSYEWYLKDSYPAKGIEKHGSKVFSCFSCGGGSTMGYKLAGYDVIGNNEIDPKMMAAYRANHNPRHSFLEPIQEFVKRETYPAELYELDILDGSPPCSSFSISGNREDDWGKEKKFREGQAKQVLDTLFFDFIELAEKLQPKVVIAENVKGILLGEARDYVRKILKDFDKAGYVVKEFLLDASRMGVPQRRERVFFVAVRKDLIQYLPANEFVMFDDFPVLDLVFFEPVITFDAIASLGVRKTLGTSVQNLYDKRLINEYCLGETAERLGKRSHFNYMVNQPGKVGYTITAKSNTIIYENGYLTDNEIIKCSSFPMDYNFLNIKTEYACGMSVPPVMTAQISQRIYEQWLKVLPQTLKQTA